MKPEVLMIIAKTNPVQLEPAVEAEYTVHKLNQTEMADCGSHIGEYKDRVRALITQTAPGADATLIGALSKLEIIACSGAHVDAIDLAAAEARNIPVTNTPGISYDDVGDYVMAQILATSRRFSEADRFVRSGRWHNEAMGFGHRVNNRKLGIVGLGPIGRVVAKRGRCFEMDVCYTDVKQIADVPYRYFDDLVEMAREVDFMAVTCKSGAATHHLIGAPVFEALGPTGVFVNISRGVVDDAALIKALGEGVIRGAGIDVFETSPHVPEELLRLDNVVLSPHVAGNTEEVTQAQSDLVMANLSAHFAGQPLLNLVEPGSH
ncbi:MAG: 2-hydroxyacid dehydrogenase [Rhodospirillales bacterium]|jgi:lactate dehydrogenase-like 2-hydroxyacid dehydrogenase|nr:2-hydroxyacid dehydrogenase [Rhodospirillales bacterium]